MKKSFLTAGIVLGLINTPIVSFATTVTSVEDAQKIEAQYQDETGALLPDDFVSDDERFETDAERLAKTSSDATTGSSTEEIVPETNVYGGYSTYQEYLEATKVDSLTEEQANEGYSINEYGQLENTNEGESYSEVVWGGVNPDDNTGYVTINVTCDTEFHEEAYVYLLNMNTYILYGCNFYEVNDYRTQIALPAGNYIIQGGGLTLDGKGRFYAYAKQFHVEATSTQILEVKLIDTEAIIDASSDSASTETSSIEDANISSIDSTIEVNIPETYVVDDTNELEEQYQFSFQTIFMMILVLASTGFLLYKFAPRKKEHEFRGFDE